MSDDDIAERLSELERRVDYIERELDVSIEEHRFEKQIEKIRPVEEYTIDTNDLGKYSAEIVTLAGDLPNVVSCVRRIDGVGWRVIGADDDTITVVVEQGLVNR